MTGGIVFPQDHPRIALQVGGKKESQLYSKEKCVQENLSNLLIAYFPLSSILIVLFISHRLVYRYSKAEEAFCIFEPNGKVKGKAIMSSNVIVTTCADTPTP